MTVLPTTEEKAVYVERMFTRIAPGYDRMNRIMTGGMDRSWRTYTVATVAPPAQGLALDIGSGTGDLLAELASWMPSGRAIGVDFTVSMMRAGLPKLDSLGGRATFVGGDALRLPFPDNTFDAITTGFTMRNVADIPTALREIWRVAKPGCVFACLEVARPRNPLLRLGHQIYFERIVPLLARLLGADATAYTYLPRSARAFPPPDTLAHMMQQAGWEAVRYSLLGLGAVAVHSGVKVRS
jgi:demethylmenaquinone methyltransferase/2-methoxy-6-polyprenyl-1,4-benzoquinol methylase